VGKKELMLIFKTKNTRMVKRRERTGIKRGGGGNKWTMTYHWRDLGDDGKQEPKDPLSYGERE